MIISIDGFIAGSERFVYPATQWDEEMQQFYLDLFTVTGAAVFGRRLYQQYMGHWDSVAAGAIPAETDVEIRWALRLRDMKKFVLSTTLRHVSGATILRGDIVGQLTRLKADSGGDLLLLCGPSLVAQLTAERLIDQYMLYVCPSALGQGVHLSRDIAELVTLRYERSRPFGAGVTSTTTPRSTARERRHEHCHSMPAFERGEGRC